MITIHVSNVSADCISVQGIEPDNGNNAMWFPELRHDCDKSAKPLTPMEILTKMSAVFSDYKTSEEHVHVMTTSEHIILLFLYWVRATTDGIEREKSIPVVYLKPSDLQIILYGHGEPKVLRINEYGEFIDRWPKPYGFFCERSQLLF